VVTLPPLARSGLSPLTQSAMERIAESFDGTVTGILIPNPFLPFINPWFSAIAVGHASFILQNLSVERRVVGKWVLTADSSPPVPQGRIGHLRDQVIERGIRPPADSRVCQRRRGDNPPITDKGP